MSGCFPPSDNRVDEEKDPHYQRGCSLNSSQDFAGAVEEFQKALESNPRSSAAHFQLGCLYDGKLKDYAAAIYHYRQYLALRTKTERVSDVPGRITLCKRELANTEFTVPNSQNLQKEIERLTAENLALKQRVEALGVQLGMALSAAQARVEIPRPGLVATQMTAANPSSGLTLSPPSQRPKTHTVKPGETMGSIAKQYRIKLSALQSANPSVDSRRLKVGQNLNLPAL